MKYFPIFQNLQTFLLILSALPLIYGQAGQKSPLCRPDLPTLAVKDIPILDIQTWDKLKKKHDTIIIGVADSQCENCCQTEGILQDYQGYGLKHKGKLIPVARIDISNKQSNAILVKEEITFDSVPRIIILKDSRFFSYDAPFDRVDLMIHHLNRLINPIVTLNTEEEVERFLGLDRIESEQSTEELNLPFWDGDYNTTFLRQLQPEGKLPLLNEHWAGLRYKTRAVGFIYDKVEYKEELQGLKRDSKTLATRDNLRLGLVDNQRLVKKMKAGKYGARLFAPVSLSSLVLRRYDGAIKMHDITGDDHVSNFFWINKNSVKEVEELNTESYRIQELIRQPMFIAFVDLLDPRYSKASYQAIEALKEVAPKYSHLINFYHVNNTLMWQRKRVLGVTWDELPALAFNMLGDVSKVMPYPRGREISKKALFDFFDDLFTGRNGGGSQIKQEYQPPTDFSKVKNDTQIESILLNNTIIANRHNFGELVYSEGYDVMVLLYTTEVINEGQRTVALQVNLVADAFKKLQEGFPNENIGKSVRIVAYDVNVNAFPEGIDFTLDLPQIIFFPAYDKRPPFRKFQGQPAIAGPLLQFIQKYSDVKFKFPVDVSRVGYPREQPAQTQVNEEPKEEETIQKNEDL